MTTSVNDILNNLFASIDDGSAFKKKEKKAKKTSAVKQAQPNAFKFHKPSLEPVAIVLLYTQVTCTCCGYVAHDTGKFPLVEKVDRYGNKHFTKFLTPSCISELPRRKMFLNEEISVCYRCFETAVLTPITDDDSAKDIKSEAEVFGSSVSRAVLDEAVEAPEVVLDVDEERALENMMALIGDMEMGDRI